MSQSADHNDPPITRNSARQIRHLGSRSLPSNISLSMRSSTTQLCRSARLHPQTGLEPYQPQQSTNQQTTMLNQTPGHPLHPLQTNATAPIDDTQEMIDDIENQ